MADDPFEMLRQREAQARVEAAQHDAEARSAADFESVRRQKAGTELAALVEHLNRERLPRRPLYKRVTEKKPGFFSDANKKTVVEYTAIGGYWQLASKLADDRGQTDTYWVLADFGRVYEGLSSVSGTLFVETLTPLGPGLEWFGDSRELAAGDAFVSESHYGPRQRLGISTAETAEFYFKVTEWGRANGRPW